MVPDGFAQARTGLTVLVVDDDEKDLRYWSDGLRKSSSQYSVIECSSGESSIDICRTQAVDCVVLDLDMPMSGFYALLKLIPDRGHPPIAVVILTHLRHPNLHDMAKHNGAQACLLKHGTTCDDLDRAIQAAVASVRSPDKQS